MRRGIAAVKRQWPAWRESWRMEVSGSGNGEENWLSKKACGWPAKK